MVFLTIFRRFSKSVPKARQTFPNIFRKFPNITKDFGGRPKDVSIIHTPTNLGDNLRDKLSISEIINIITSDDMENTSLESGM